MSILPKESIEVIAQSIGISNLSPDVALALAPDVEYRLREVMQEAIKCMRHSRRTRMTPDDVDGALNIKNIEDNTPSVHQIKQLSSLAHVQASQVPCLSRVNPSIIEVESLSSLEVPDIRQDFPSLETMSYPIYSFASGGPLHFKRVAGHRDLFYFDDKDVDFKDVIEAPLPKAPLDTAVFCHWLAIEGVQPAIPENPTLEVIAAPVEDKRYEEKEDGPPVDIKLPVKHVLSRELQLYFDKITELVLGKSDSVLFKQALASLATDSGLHPLVPYFTCFIADEVSRGLNDYSLLFALMRVVWSLLQNPHIHMEPYLHQLMPSVVTCLVSKRLGNRFTDNHWELRDFTANLVASICKRFGHVYNTLQTRLTKTLLNAFLDPKRAITQHYGAIQGLASLGPNVVRLLILPNLEPYLQLLEPELLLENQKNEMKRYEAWRVYGALLRAAGKCIYDRLKIFPPLQSVAAHAFWKANARVALPNKRKRPSDEEDQWPPLKKIATDGPISEAASNSFSSHFQEEKALVASSGDTNVGPSPSFGKVPDVTISDRRGKRDEGDESLKTAAILSQVWKDDLNSGQLLISLIEQFGEGILSFMPTPETSLFL